ncbi:extracellular lipase [Penicillium malachiteum]|uniref:Extracellular lipase n=1 Tax=Penicillium malachiteum TaxID=1324776 RepID=A0AAD6MYH8_9EURO|nr:extracellular lipase [Penicillium malachiteum]
MTNLSINEDAVNEIVDRGFYPKINFVAEMMGIKLPRNPEDDQFSIPTESLPDQNANSSSAELCQACAGMTIKELKSDEGYLHTEEIEDFFESAKTCPLCALLQQTMCNAVRFHIQRKEPIEDPVEAIDLFAAFMAVTEHCYMFRPTPVVLKLDRGAYNDLNDDYLVMGTILKMPIQNAKALALHFGRLLLHDNKRKSVVPILPRGNDEEVLRRLSAWLDERRKEVPAWSDASVEKPLPTRVLDLGQPCLERFSQESLEQDLRLVESNGQRGHYTTLSYCWGGYSEFKTTRSNYHDRLEGIMFADLPKTYADAVCITRSLGVRYLWIDALCIIQEDPKDWLHEAGCMSDIFWNTTCRIAANEGKDPTEGFFPPKETPASIKVPNLVGEELSTGLSDVEKNTPKDDDDQGQNYEADYLGTSTFEEVPASSEDPTSTDVNFTESIIPDISEQTSVEFLDREDELLDGTLDQSSYSGDHDDYINFNSNQPMEIDEQDSHLENPDGSLNDALDELMERIDRNLKIHREKPVEPEEEEKPFEMYLSSPKAYAIDVDRGHLNTRGWVLQERLLASRTIHFTKNHIYCEDQDDICGEDWVRRYFTWRSSIDKTSQCSRAELFPERGFSSSLRDVIPEGGDRNLWFQRRLYRRADGQYVPHPWLKICELFSKCELSYDVDRLAAIAGLVKKKQELRQISAVESGEQVNIQNFFGMWEENLHSELCWVAADECKAQYLHHLNLPSWAWIAYKGRIEFTRDRRWSRNPGPVREAPISEMELIEYDVPDMLTELPLMKPASITIRAPIRKIHSISRKKTTYVTEDISRKDLAKSSPFHFDERTGTMPIPMAHRSECQDMFDEGGRIVGFVSFDEDRQLVGDLFCAHISTLRDEILDFPKQNFDETDETEYDIQHSCPPILAYALILIRVDSNEGTLYRRVGMAELNYEWMLEGVSSKAKII